MQAEPGKTQIRDASPELRRIAQAQVTGPLAAASKNPGDPRDEAEVMPDAVRLEEVLVTGSHIRGVQGLSSPMITFDRKEIEASGYATTQQFIQSIPQNLSNISDATTGAANGGLGTPASYDSAGVNLRGLGGDATLVLMNGRRMAAAGNGSFVD